MAPLRAVLFATLAACTAAVTPVAKVITLLEDLKTQVETEGKAEASAYDDYACFCKKTTGEKSESISLGNDDINDLSAAIADDTASKAEKGTELRERKGDDERLKGTLAETTARCNKEKAAYEAEAADLNKAIASLEKAIDSMEGGKASFVQVASGVKEVLALAEVMNLITEPKHKAAAAFLQSAKATVDPSDPDYQYHSQGIISTLDKLLVEFRAEKDSLDTEWGKTKKNCEKTIADLNSQIEANDIAMEQLEIDIENLQTKIGSDRGDLVIAEEQLKDDQAYLKDLTKQCEDRANDWDQRSSMRRDELSALAGALEVLTDKVADRDEQVNARALLQAQAQARKVTVAAHSEAVAFVQESATVNTATKERAVHVVTMLKREGGRLGSPVLSALATKVEGKLSDPFDKIKGLIQELIERLLAESEAEATKKGFCDTELGKANQDRDFRMKDAKELNIELEALEIKKADLEAEIELLSDELDTLKDNLKTATSARVTEHGENVEQIKVAKEGVVAVKEAITILKVFYKNAAKAKSFIQASPVDEDTSGPGFKGNYAGNQSASKGIIGMLEVIHSDFDRTVRTVTASEQKAHEEFTKFDRTSKADIAGKTTKSDLDKEDLKTTDNTIESKMGDLKTAVDLLDGALERLEELKPTCVDSGMSYAKRVEKREEEMSALKNALCILDTDNVESECA